MTETYIQKAPPKDTADTADTADTTDTYLRKIHMNTADNANAYDYMGILCNRVMTPSVSVDLVFEDVAFVVVGGEGDFVN